MPVAAPAIKTSKNNSAMLLAHNVERSDKNLLPFVRLSQKLSRRYCGPHHPRWDSDTDGPMDAQPINTTFSFVEIMMPYLSSSTLSTHVTPKTPSEEGTWFAFKLQAQLDHVCQEIKLAMTMERIARAAMFGMGIARVGHNPPAVGEWDEPFGHRRDAGQPLVEWIRMMDYILDPDCLDHECVDFEGHRYRLPVEYAYDSGRFPHELLDAMTPIHNQPQDQMQAMGNNREPDNDGPLVPKFEFRDLWIPHGNRIVTLPGRVDHTTDYLSDRPYEGAENGPYYKLSYADDPDGPFSVTTLSVVMDLDTTINTLTRKVQRQADRAKRLGIYNKADETTADTIRTAKDGSMVGVPGGKDAVGTYDIPGPDSKSYEPIGYFDTQRNAVAGNPSLLGGEKAQSGTLGQDQMLEKGASVRIEGYRKKTKKFASEVLMALAWEVWTDKESENALTLDFGAGGKIPDRWTPEAREGDFLDYVYDIQPYSANPAGPEEEYAATMEIVQTVVIPLAPQMAATGQYVDTAELVATLAEKRHLTDTHRWFKNADKMAVPATNSPDQQQPQGGGRMVAGTKPAQGPQT